MKKIIIAAVLIFMITAGCDDEPENTSYSSTKPYSATAVRYYGYEIWTIAGCEYIVYGVGYGQMMSHMGTCKNPIHKQIVHDTVIVDPNVAHSKIK